MGLSPEHVGGPHDQQTHGESSKMLKKVRNFRVLWADASVCYRAVCFAQRRHAGRHIKTQQGGNHFVTSSFQHGLETRNSENTAHAQ